MGNCLWKFNDKTFALGTPPLTSGRIKKVTSGIWKNPVKYFATGVHQKYGYERFTQSIKSRLMDVLNGGASLIKISVIKGQEQRSILASKTSLQIPTKRFEGGTDQRYHPHFS